MNPRAPEHLPATAPADFAIQEKRPKPRSLEDLPAFVRARDLRDIGLTRLDAERVMAKCAGVVQFGKAIYVKRDDVESVLAAAFNTSEVR